MTVLCVTSHELSSCQISWLLNLVAFWFVVLWHHYTCTLVAVNVSVITCNIGLLFHPTGNYCASQPPPPRLSEFFSLFCKRLRIFSQFFTHQTKPRPCIIDAKAKSLRGQGHKILSLRCPWGRGQSSRTPSLVVVIHKLKYKRKFSDNTFLSNTVTDIKTVS